MNENKKIILVVEDEEPLQLVLRDILTTEGYKVFEAKNGVEGLEIALHEHPHLILLDILMPKMDGLEMLKKLREDAWGKTASVIVLTNLSDNEDVAKAVESDVFEYFVKSDIKIDEVIARIREKIGK
ncbi:MAG: response regulator transcription factor [Candidatus Pacebacteria bacterium]|jgi:DNA-binding response OmpR family regulator|nr:response regulator transcription factor [Candidatus Paceibacterota bacterium]